MSTYQSRLTDVVQRDPRFAYEAYEFVFVALSHTQKILGRVPADDGRIPGPEFIPAAVGGADDGYEFANKSSCGAARASVGPPDFFR